MLTSSSSSPYPRLSRNMEYSDEIMIRSSIDDEEILSQEILDDDENKAPPLENSENTQERSTERCLPHFGISTVARTWIMIRIQVRAGTGAKVKLELGLE